MKLTAKQAKFCEEYLIDLNGKQAAIRAGYEPKTAEVQASRMLSYAKVKEYIKQKQEELSKRTQITTEWVVNRLLAISNRCMQPNLKMVREGKEWIPATDEDGNLIYEFDSAGANRATELLGKHLGAFEADNKQKNLIIDRRVGFSDEIE